VTKFQIHGEIKNGECSAVLRVEKSGKSEMRTVKASCLEALFEGARKTLEEMEKRL
jgi:hypothetical protein